AIRLLIRRTGPRDAAPTPTACCRLRSLRGLLASRAALTSARADARKLACIVHPLQLSLLFGGHALARPRTPDDQEPGNGYDQHDDQHGDGR
ncbi:MAG TPA: hypothetical protein VLM76_12280, partial [Patescibacteria group bacterium]|nr:hypothetical protein [Patescibacteria group bacterium]